MKRSRSVQQQPPLPTTKAWPRGESWVLERKSCSCLCSDCWFWVQSSCTRCWDAWHGLKLSSKRQAAASSLNLRRNSMLRITRVRLRPRMNWWGTSEPSSDPRHRNSEPTGQVHPGAKLSCCGLSERAHSEDFSE